MINHLTVKGNSPGPAVRRVLECVPNISEGRDPRVLDAIAQAIRSVPGVRLADIHADPDHHRSVFTFLGPPEAVETAALAMAIRALPLIDMRGHRGVHPRIGAVDVVPFVPLEGVTVDGAVEIAHRFGQTLGERHGVPVFFYGEAALRPERRRLPDLRRGQYEGLGERLRDPAGQPDSGPTANTRSGATAVGVRGVLIAFNVLLASPDVALARAIARKIRESSGGLPAVQAMGVHLASRDLAQVSMNLLDYRKTSPWQVYEAIREEAARRGVVIHGAELVGLAPRAAIEEFLARGVPGFRPEQCLEHHLGTT